MIYKKIFKIYYCQFGQHYLWDTVLVDRVKEDRIKILLLSVLMLPSAIRIKEVTDNLKRDNIDIKIIVGGAPFRFDNNLWKEVGADATGIAASDAVRIVSEFQGELI